MVDVAREPLSFTKDEFLRARAMLPERLEFVRGDIGPFSDEAVRMLIANWGADRIVAITGSEVWRQAAEAKAACD